MVTSEIHEKLAVKSASVHVIVLEFSHSAQANCKRMTEKKLQIEKWPENVANKSNYRLVKKCWLRRRQTFSNEQTIDRQRRDEGLPTASGEKGSGAVLAIA